MALRALIAVLVGDQEDGVFADEHGVLAPARAARVRARGQPARPMRRKAPLAEALGRLLYLVHLAVLLWWLLDKSPQQRATAALVALAQHVLPRPPWLFVFPRFENT